MNFLAFSSIIFFTFSNFGKYFVYVHFNVSIFRIKQIQEEIPSLGGFITLDFTEEILLELCDIWDLMKVASP